ncbi:VWA domain-containing protein [Polaribacter sp. SA4-10]|uniref:VWA domain-containing protein n=1 Tax=Polaribacter sp. SA4-10 TaxID=754397 RepID=UPI001E598BB7|nr:VWA domain-containing protein [Polaribacter sp. SA4-10]
MQITTILYIIIALLLSISVAFFQYFYSVKSKTRINTLLFVLKTFSLFLLLLLLINPTIKNTELKNSIPVLAVLVDNSKSIPFFKEEKNVENFIEALNNNKSLNEKFLINEFTFGSSLRVLDSVSFNESETNISEAILAVNELNKDKIAPIILITDGNQTIGNDYEFINSKQPIYPLVVGDTIKYRDLRISQLNVNKYSYIKNKFPVEVLLNYDGKEKVNTTFSIYKNGKSIFTQKVQFSSSEKSKTITANLTSTKEGLQYYTASVRKIADEKNTKNNTKNFSVEVINEQTKVLILTSVLHPDIGTLTKSIESNKQRSVDVFLIDKFKGNLINYQLVILNQPTAKFISILNDLKKANSNYFIVSGVNTDWKFINKQQLGFTKKAINETESYGAIFNDSFLIYQQKNIGFDQFPPLKDKFGEVVLSKEHQKLLAQNINGVETEQPLLATFEQNNKKWAVLFGEGIWKWRSASFLSNNSFQDFDEFIGNLVQYLASDKKRNRLEVNSESLYSANSTINLSAFYTDKNYKFDARASLEITITNSETREITKLPFSLVNTSYQIEIENLISGDYTYKVAVIGQDINKYGKFKITTYQIEEQFTNANSEKLEKLAKNSGGILFYKNQIDDLSKELLENTAFYTTQKSTIKEQNLIDWKWILFIVIGLFTAEWFIRKYYGKI